MANWDKINSRGNVSDRRGAAPVVVGGVSVLGIALVLGAAMIGGGDAANLVLDVLEETQGSSLQSNENTEATGEFAGDDEYEAFASAVLGSNNDIWRSYFNSINKTYNEPELVLFRGGTTSGCGGASSAIGPHYCPLDGTIYLDETFFDELKVRFGARGGDVAEAYVIAHEVGHHVQTELGITSEVRQAQSRNSNDKNELSIKQELQADCFAGIWAKYMNDNGVFEQGEILEAIDAAEAVGDDRIQQSTTGRVNEDQWTHGSSEDRKEWLTRGFETGSFSQCDTF